MRFDSYHPTINFIFFTAVITFTILFRHPAYLAISFVSAFVYSVKLNGKKAVVFNASLILLIAVYAAFYASYNHFGVTNIGENAVGNMITLESIIYGALIGTIIAAVLMWLSCVHSVVSSDKAIYLFGRITPKLSLFLSISLRMVPHIKDRARKINTAQRAIGRGANQGNFGRRCRNAIRLISIVITWTLENMIETSDSMRSRGYALKGRTAFSIYRFDNRDRSFIISLFCAITVVLAGFALDQMRVLYDPQIVMNPITPLSYLFYAAYAFLCLLPMALQIIGEWKFVQLRKRNMQTESGGLL